MPVKKSTKAEAEIECSSCADCECGSQDNSWKIIFFMVITAFINIVAVWLMLHGWNFWGIKLAWGWISGDAVKQAILDVEYAKVWWKENYGIINKMQLQQIEQFVAQYKKQGWQDTTTTPQAPTSELKTMTTDELSALKEWSYTEWNKDAKIAIFEFSDTECPFCIRQYKDGTIEATLKTFDGKVNSSFKNLPLEFHKNAEKEAEAAQCAWSLWWSDAYIKYYKTIFDRTEGNGEWFALSSLVPLAKELGLNEKKFQDCLDNWAMADKVKKEMALAKKYGITWTPASLIVNKETLKYTIISWAYPASDFESKINELLK